MARRRDQLWGSPLSRRDVLRSGAAAAGAYGAWRLFGSSGAAGDGAMRWTEGRHKLRTPDSLPDPSRPAGTPDDLWPFDHVVVLMMENHSFDNLLGDLSRTRRDVVGQFSYDTRAPIYTNRDAKGNVVAPWHITTTCQPGGVDQSWNVSHRSMFWSYGNSPETSYTQAYDPATFDYSAPLSQVPLAPRTMQGFVIANGGTPPMGYWTADELPFTHSMAQAFTIANFWFCSTPCQTYPNRRFLYAGTAFGDISTDNSTIFDTSTVPPSIVGPPPNGTIFDRLSQYGIPWRNYFYDLPNTGIIPTTVQKYPTHIVPVEEFFADCAAGTLPAVSFVDPESGVPGVAGGAVASLPGVRNLPGVQSANDFVQTIDGDQESPADMAYGENFVARVVNAVLASPAWERTLLIWTFDEHGGYADHIPPPAAIPPDGIGPQLAKGDFVGGYDLYGPRVPAVVVSAYARPSSVSNVVYDHTSVLATIEAKWNLPACTYRDANAATVRDCLQTTAALLDPPVLPAPAPALPGGLQCSSPVPSGVAPAVP